MELCTGAKSVSYQSYTYTRKVTFKVKHALIYFFLLKTVAYVDA